MNQFPPEYSIMMLKPDSLALGLAPAIERQVRDNQLRIVRRKSLRLTEQDVQDYFLHPTSEYVQFLTSAPVEMYLLSGYNPHIALYDLKKHIRRAYNVQGKIYNLLHTVDQGNEYHLFLHRFFPELNPLLYCNIADYDLYVPEDSTLPALLDTLRYLDTRSGLQYCVLRFSRLSQLEWFFALKEIQFQRLHLAFSTPISLAGWERQATLLLVWPDEIQDLKSFWSRMQAISTMHDLQTLHRDYPCTSYLNGFLLSREELETYRWWIRHEVDELDERLLASQAYASMEGFVKAGVQGLMCFRPDFSLLETEYRMDLCRLLHWHRRGGSSGQVPPGHFSVSVDCVEDKG